MPYSSEEYQKAYREKYAPTKNEKRRLKYASDKEYREKQKALSRSWWHNSEYRKKHDEPRKAKNRQKYAENPEYRQRVLNTSAKQGEANKLAVLSHYGKGRQPCCCWPDCMITDIDMLTLDHINNDGAEHRKTLGDRKMAGGKIYRWIIKNGFPDGFQTLCANHQFKKEILRKREKK